MLSKVDNLFTRIFLKKPLLTQLVDAYLQKIEPKKRVELERILQIGKAVVPEATEVISYGMPTLQYRGRSFLGFDAHQNHVGIYPYGGEEIEVFQAELEQLNYKFSKGAIQVPYDRPFPRELLEKIILHRIKRI